jgi:hypothetical protein
VKTPCNVVVAFSAVLMSFLAIAEDKGQCPGFLHPGRMVSSKRKGFTHQKLAEPSEKPAPGAEYLGRITIFSAVSDKGYVCDAAIQVGVDSQVDETILRHFRAQHFPPIVQNGSAVPANVIVDVNVWRTTKGEVVEFPEPKLPKL